MHFLLVSLSLCLRLSYLENHCSAPAAATVVGGRPGLQHSSALFGPEFRLRLRLRLMPNASKLFAPIVRGRAQYCVANVPSNFPTVHGHLGSFFVGYSPHERTPWQRFRFRGPQAAMPSHAMSPGPRHGHGHESGPCVRLESFVLFDL